MLLVWEEREINTGSEKNGRNILIPHTKQGHGMRSLLADEAYGLKGAPLVFLAVHMEIECRCTLTPAIVDNPNELGFYLSIVCRDYICICFSWINATELLSKHSHFNVLCE